MNDQTLDILKACLIALIYLFIGRVVWVVSKELRGTPLAAPIPQTSPSGPQASSTTEQKRHRRWRITVREPRGLSDEPFLVSGELTIGRGGGCAISLADDTFASALHARLFLREDTLWIEDLGSTNGTTVNGVAISSSTQLRKGDMIGVGGTALGVDR